MCFPIPFDSFLLDAWEDAPSSLGSAVPPVASPACRFQAGRRFLGLLSPSLVVRMERRLLQITEKQFAGQPARESVFAYGESGVISIKNIFLHQISVLIRGQTDQE